MENKSHTGIWAIICIIALAAIGLYYYSTTKNTISSIPTAQTPVGSGATKSTTSTKPVAEIVVNYTKDGFSPKTITVLKGTVVKLVNRTNKPFWPTTGKIVATARYQQFDPGQSIIPTGAYINTLYISGTIKYYDKLNPKMTGIIIVK